MSQVVGTWVAEDMHLHVTWPMVLHVDNVADASFQHSICGNTRLKGIFKISDDWIKQLKDEDLVKSVQDCKYR